ncbi:MAG: tetratricopeptide repeat protein [Bacteroidota bacterium]
MKLITIYLFTLFNFNASGQEAEKLNSQGKVYEQDYRFKKAIKLYSEAIDMEPNNANFYLDRGLLFLKLERPVEAKADLAQVVSLDLQNVNGWQAMAEYFLYKEVPDSAIFCVNRSISFDWDNKNQVKNLMIRADAQMLRGKFPLAYDDYIEVVKTDSANTRVLRNLAYTLYHMDRDKECIHYLKKIAKNNPGDTESLINVGYSMTQIGMFQESMEYFNTVLEYDKGQPYALSNRAYAYHKQGFDDAAMKDIKQSIGNDPKNSYAYWVRGLISVSKGETKKGCKDFKKAEKFDYREDNRKTIQDSIEKNCQ